MKYRDTQEQRSSLRTRWGHSEKARFVDWHNLQKPTWRDAFNALAGPATRIHRYRNLRTGLFEDATERVDIKDCG